MYNNTFIIIHIINNFKDSFFISTGLLDFNGTQLRYKS